MDVLRMQPFVMKRLLSSATVTLLLAGCGCDRDGGQRLSVRDRRLLAAASVDRTRSWR
jgi:hypothetical protein